MFFIIIIIIIFPPTISKLHRSDMDLKKWSPRAKWTRHARFVSIYALAFSFKICKMPAGEVFKLHIFYETIFYQGIKKKVLFLLFCKINHLFLFIPIGLFFNDMKWNEELVVWWQWNEMDFYPSLILPSPNTFLSQGYTMPIQILSSGNVWSSKCGRCKNCQESQGGGGGGGGGVRVVGVSHEILWWMIKPRRRRRKKTWSNSFASCPLDNLK